MRQLLWEAREGAGNDQGDLGQQGLRSPCFLAYGLRRATESIQPLWVTLPGEGFPLI